MTKTKSGDTIAAIASQIFNGDVTRFTELLDLNPDIDVFGELVEGLDLELPDTSQILNYARPVLSQIGETLDTATNTLTTLQTQLPSNLQGYAADALKLLGDVNGVLGDVETTLTKTQEQVSSYDGKPVQLVKWLLGGQV
ncbi:hypothetical protein [Nostoc sp. GT001]|uniref:hypothetical protein n=1 Tax=Nostoc sp. GT001 TaxID=3056647 RepID=UPI0025AA7EEE|nr:hypothetical protein [Nostoc sp. GT001]MDM9583096.1 hypothetical protein [Nostoc sp. GT001]